ncbi:hypothetical protein [Curtobacterium ammoniigenes]|uniref:hypothetical protein n=1 Tax=Curtobacterium ammoniigenes TaxID=395387 RepID=UPI00082D94DF|nr:hypothetical protein [Curtobacterium ammoniigenes]
MSGGSGQRASVSGWERIDAPALIRTAQAVAAEAMSVPSDAVSARVIDDGRGALAIVIDAPLIAPMLGAPSASWSGGRAFSTRALAGPDRGGAGDSSAIVRAHRSRSEIAERVQRITGRRVHRVDIDFTAAVIDAGRRVR